MRGMDARAETASARGLGGPPAAAGGGYPLNLFCVLRHPVKVSSAQSLRRTKGENHGLRLGRGKGP